MARPIRRPGNLPAEATSFIGRRRELAELRTKLAAARLVTLVGPGGVGKTRLAIRGATELARAFPGGAWLVELADVRDPGLVQNAVLGALDLRDQAATGPRAVLLAYLEDKELLLLVDNCEHVIDAAAALAADIVRKAPGVRVIATSREPLAVPGEHLLPVPPLELPSAAPGEPLERLRLNESVELFVERASAASGGFALSEANRAAVVDLCRRLDGLPLAIELAAVRTRVLAVEQIRDRLADRFGLLTGGGRATLPRHQTLRTAIEWSHDLLTPAERTLLRRLSVFAGRFTLDDVEAVCASDDVLPRDVLDLVASLVAKSLVTADVARGVACYRLHETMREFARLRLREAGEEDAVEQGCVDYFVARCRSGWEDPRYDLGAWLDWLDLEIDTIRSILRRCVDRQDAVIGLGLALSLHGYWATRATTEGVRWLDQLLELGTSPPEAQARGEYLRGFLLVLLVDPVAAMPSLERAVVADRAAGRGGPLVTSLSMAAIASNMAGDRSAARGFMDEAEGLRAALATGASLDPGAVQALLQARALDGFFAGDVEAATSASLDGIQLARETGDLYTLKVWLLNLGTAALVAGDRDAAATLLAEALQLAYRLDDRVQLAYLLDAAGCLRAASGNADAAARLLGAGGAMRVVAGAQPMPFFAPLVEQAAASARTALGGSRYQAAHDAGGRLDRDAAVRLALGRPEGAAAVQSGGGAPGPLSPREREVARLVADGLTNKEIGARLFISEHTVDTHIRGILNKLGFDSRARIAAWIAAESE
jgi:predicted ATPase/DNA-binding CsgD family transcriptional regulator